MPLAVNVDAVAFPVASLIWVSTLVAVLANVPVAPVLGTVKMTVTPTAAAPVLLVNVTDIVGNAVPATVARRVVAVVTGLATMVGVTAYARSAGTPVLTMQAATARTTAAFVRPRMPPRSALRAPG